MFHIRKVSSTIKGRSPISILYPKNKVRVMGDQSFHEVSEKPELLQISLRPFELTDVDDFMVWATDDQVSRFCGWETYKSKEDVLKYIKDWVIPHPWYRAICLKNQPIGTIFVHPYRGADRCRGEIGYVLASKHWGKGIATTAVKMVLGSVFKDWPHLERLEGLVDVENLGSQKVLEKAGFLKEGVLRKYYIQKGRTIDMVIFGFLSTDIKQLD